jgi:hypothetical protein
MVDAATARRLARALPDTTDASTEAALRFETGGKGFAWSFMERLEPRKPRQPRLDILAVRCPLETKDMLVESAPDRFFDDDHYRGYPAVLVRLAAIDEDELAALLDRAATLVKAPAKRRKS